MQRNGLLMKCTNGYRLRNICAQVLNCINQKGVSQKSIHKKNELKNRRQVLRSQNQIQNGTNENNQQASRDKFKVKSALVEELVQQQDLTQIPLDPHPDLKSGFLDNGVEYHILDNHNPPGRFEVQIEVHAGSINETKEEQGIAHLAEHVTYLGSDKREILHGDGVKSNAFTDFHHTVFHFNAPIQGVKSKDLMLKRVFDCLEEIVFKPALEKGRIDKEKKAVQAEYRMMNTMEYRQDVEVIKNLHMDNMISRRFPIGKMENVKSFDKNMLTNYWRKWYQPDNVSLFIVGEAGFPKDQIFKEINHHFGKYKVTREPLNEQQKKNLTAIEQYYNEFQNKLENGEESQQGRPNSNGNLYNNISIQELANIDNYLSYQHGIRDRMRILHNWGLGPISISKQVQQTLDKQYLETQFLSTEGKYQCPVDIYQHPLIPQVTIYLQNKTPVVKNNSVQEIKWLITQRLVTTTFQSRVCSVLTKYPSSCVQLMSQDSMREDCAITNLIIICKPEDWKEILSEVVKEAQRLAKHGLTQSEFDMYKQVTLSNAFIESQQENTFDNGKKIEFMMDILSTGHTFIKDEKLFDYTQVVLQSLTIEECQYYCQQYMAFISHFGREQEYLEGFKRNPNEWNYGWPLRSTGVLACVPLYKDQKLEVIQNRPQKSGSLSMSQHIDPALLEQMSEQTDIEEESKEQQDLEVDNQEKFQISKEELTSVLAHDYGNLEQASELDTIEYLVPPDVLTQKIQDTNPHFVPPLENDPDLRPMDPSSAISFRKLSNGVRVVLKQTNLEPELITLRLSALGGFLHDKAEDGPYGLGAMRAAQSSQPARQRIGKMTNSQTDNFLLLNNVILAQNSLEEFTITDVKAQKDPRYLQKCFEVLHTMSSTFIWNEEAYGKAKESIVEMQNQGLKNLEDYATYLIINQMYGKYNRINFPDEKQVNKLTMDAARQIYSQVFNPENMEIVIAGDFDIEVIEKYILEYLGTLGKQEHYIEQADNTLIPIENKISEQAKSDYRQIKPILIRKQDNQHKKHLLIHQQDSDERALAILQSRSPSRYGYPDSPLPLPNKHLDKNLLRTIGQKLEGALSSGERIGFVSSELKNLAGLKEQHPLYAIANQVILQDILTSRLFNTVRDQYGLTYDVQFSMNNFEVTKGGLWQIRVMAEPSKILMAAEASMETLQILSRKKQLITFSEVQRAQMNIKTRIEQESQTNEYWIEQMMLLENPIQRYKVLETITHVFTYLYSMTASDLNQYISQFDFNVDNIYTLIGVAGQEPLDFEKSYKKIIMERVKQQNEDDQREDFAKYFVQDEDWYKQQGDLKTKFNFWKKVSKVVQDASNKKHLIM